VRWRDKPFIFNLSLFASLIESNRDSYFRGSLTLSFGSLNGDLIRHTRILMQFPERQETLDLIEAYKIPTCDIARFACLAVPRVSDFKADRRVESAQSAKIADAVNKIARVLGELSPLRVDTRDPANVRTALKELDRIKSEQIAAETAELVRQADAGLNAVLSTNWTKGDFMVSRKEISAMIERQRLAERWVKEIPSDSPNKDWGEECAALSRHYLTEVIESAERIERLDED
jgi:hypothetical protein